MTALTLLCWAGLLSHLHTAGPSWCCWCWIVGFRKSTNFGRTGRYRFWSYWTIWQAALMKYTGASGTASQSCWLLSLAHMKQRFKKKKKERKKNYPQVCHCESKCVRMYRSWHVAPFICLSWSRWVFFPPPPLRLMPASATSNLLLLSW